LSTIHLGCSTESAFATFALPFDNVLRQKFCRLNMAVNASFASPSADAKTAHMITQLDSSSFLTTIVNGMSVWTVLFTLFVCAVAYDQCTNCLSQCAERH